MKFDWAQYLALTRKWEAEAHGGTTDGDEALLRCAVSRAYYAAFALARTFLRDREGHGVPRNAAHQYVCDAFAWSADEQRQIIGDRLSRLLRFRNKADYDEVFADLPSVANFAIVLAEDIIDRIETL